MIYQELSGKILSRAHGALMSWLVGGRAGQCEHSRTVAVWSKNGFCQTEFISALIMLMTGRAEAEAGFELSHAV